MLVLLRSTSFYDPSNAFICYCLNKWRISPQSHDALLIRSRSKHRNKSFKMRAPKIPIQNRGKNSHLLYSSGRVPFSFPPPFRHSYYSVLTFRCSMFRCYGPDRVNQLFLCHARLRPTHVKKSYIMVPSLNGTKLEWYVCAYIGGNTWFPGRVQHSYDYYTVRIWRVWSIRPNPEGRTRRPNFTIRPNI